MQRHLLVNNYLEYSAEVFPDKEALIFKNGRYTYAEIESNANKLAHELLKSGVEKGDRIAIFMENSVHAVTSLFAALKSSAAFVVINSSTKAQRLEYILNNCEAKVLLADDNKLNIIEILQVPHLKSIISTGSDENKLVKNTLFDIFKFGNNNKVVSRCIDLDLASIIYTSGSTGDPKGVMLSHLNMLSAAHSITSYLENNDQDVIINLLPLSFDYGLYQVLMSFKVGGTLVFESNSSYPYEIVNTLQREKVTGFPGLPTIFAMLFMLKDISKFDLSSLRYITNTGTPLPQSYTKKLRQLIPQAKIYSMYGLTECKRVSFLDPDELEKRPDSVGKAMPNVEVYVVNNKDEEVGAGEVGELVVRGANVMLGYWNMPEETEKSLRSSPYSNERVLHTGDIFRIDNQGYLYFVRRKDDIIKCKGEKVSPREIESVLYNLDGIEEVAVVGVPDEVLGQSIKAYVVINNETELNVDKILNHCSKHLENFKIPKRVEIMESLPKTLSGKIDKKKISSQKIYEYLFNNALKTPQKIAVVQNEEQITYEDLGDKTYKLASYLIQNGINKGDRVAILSDNSPEYIASCYGIQKAGGISVDINPQYSPDEIIKVLDDCCATILIMENKFLQQSKKFIRFDTSINKIIVMDTDKNGLALNMYGEIDISLDINVIKLSDVFEMRFQGIEFPDVHGDDIASIVYTSGTTGDPKGVMLSHDNFLWNAKSIIKYLNLNSDDKIMVVLPFYYSYGKSLLNTHILNGGSLVLENSFMYPNIILDKMIKEGVTGFAGVPSSFTILLNRSNIKNYSFKKLRYVTQAGGAMSPKHTKELSDTLPNTEIYIMYGQTEATARLTYLNPQDLFRKLGSIGKPIPGVDIKLIKENGILASVGEEGEITARGKNIMLGYWNKPYETEKVLKGNRLHTGDIARMDSEGFLYIVGRRSDMIKSGAHRISPKEIEEVILEMDEVHEVTVVGMDDDILGEVIRAIIVLKDGYSIDAKEVIKFCQSKLAQFKVPKEVVFVDELPKTSSGKIQKHLCRDLTLMIGASK